MMACLNLRRILLPRLRQKIKITDQWLGPIWDIFLPLRHDFNDLFHAFQLTGQDSFPREIYRRCSCPNSIYLYRHQHEAPGNKPYKLCSYSSEPRTEVYCFRLNFNISKLGYCLCHIVICGGS